MSSVSGTSLLPFVFTPTTNATATSALETKLEDAAAADQGIVQMLDSVSTVGQALDIFA
ncbi:MAG: hypothetical protein PW788_09675 [Micavibrio sp.]|nr:hypothetical protein [Micavibrio sp.]